MLTNPAPYAHVTCPRCGIDHRDCQRARRWVLCADCKPYGPGWMERARREVDRLARHPQESCRRGHPLTDDNVYTRPDGAGRECLTCRLQRRGSRAKGVA